MLLLLKDNDLIWFNKITNLVTTQLIKKCQLGKKMWNVNYNKEQILVSKNTIIKTHWVNKYLYNCQYYYIIIILYNTIKNC